MFLIRSQAPQMSRKSLASRSSDEKSTRRFPLLLTTGRVLTQYNVGAQTRRTDNTAWHPEDVLEIIDTERQAGTLHGVMKDLIRVRDRVRGRA